MGYWFNKKTSLASFPPYFLFFGCEAQLLTFIHKDVVDVTFNLDDLANVWI
jgi:hypothetical protein